MDFLDLFSGIGAYALGVTRGGGRVRAFCENNKKCHVVLRAQFPGVPIYDDVEALTGERLRADGVRANWIVAGWPCQDLSVAGSGLGLDGARSGLWPHIPRLAGEMGAEGLLLENSSNLLTLDGGRHFERVLGDLAALGFDAEWHCLPAAAFDAPHIRDRLWIVARRDVADDARHGLRGAEAASRAKRKRAGARGEPSGTPHDANAPRNGRNARRKSVAAEVARGRQSDRAYLERDLADADGAGSQVRPQDCGRTSRPHADDAWRAAERGSALPYSDCYAPIGAAIARRERHTWEPEPDVVRVVHGAPARVDRIHGLGNCNPPIVPETIVRAVLEAKRPSSTDGVVSRD
jgi:DNA (cytosine-5)-methyltransferase 1